MSGETRDPTIARFGRSMEDSGFAACMIKLNMAVFCIGEKGLIDPVQLMEYMKGEHEAFKKRDDK